MLADALARARIHGVRTNRDLLVNVLRHPAFIDGATDTAFFDTHGLADLAAPLSDDRSVALSAVAAALADAAQNRSSATVFAAAPAAGEICFRVFRPSPTAMPQATSTKCATASPARAWNCPTTTPSAWSPRARSGSCCAVDGVDRPFDVARYGARGVRRLPAGPGATGRAAPLR